MSTPYHTAFVPFQTKIAVQSLAFHDVLLELATVNLEKLIMRWYHAQSEPCPWAAIQIQVLMP